MKGGPQTWNEFKKNPVGITRACISLDGTRIAAVFTDKTLCIYDTTGEATLPPFVVDEYPRSVIFSRDGKLVASGGQALRLWNVETREMVQSFNIKVYSLALSPDGTCIVAGCEARKGPQERYREGMDMSNSYNIRVINMELVKIPDDHDPYLILRPSGRMRLKGEILSSPFEGHTDHVRSVAYSADGKQIASCSNEWAVRVWDVSTGSGRTFKSGSNEIHSVAIFSPDDTQIVSDIGLFNLSTGSFTPHTFCNREKEVGNREKAISFFGIKLKASSSGNREKENFSFALSTDHHGRFLALGSHGACQIWHTKPRTIVQLSGHIDDVTSVAFFPDGKQMMSASMDGSIRVSNVELLEEREEMDRWRSSKDKDGHWILGPKKEHIFWTLLPFRHTRNTLVIGECQCMKIDFSNFVHGDEWWKCGEPLQRKETRDEGVILP